MSVLLTGGAGYIGKGVLKNLVAADYKVVALVDSDEDAEQVRADGAEAFLAEEDDSRTLAELALESDGVIHTATARGEDDQFVASVFPGLVTSDKPFIYTGSLWAYGAGSELTEASPLAPPAPVEWIATMQTKLMSSDAVRVAVIVPGVVYGHGQGIPRTLVDAADDGSVPIVGDGTQRWATVHVDDLADLYRLVLETTMQTNKLLSHNNEVYFAVNETAETVADLAAAAAASLGPSAAVAPASAERDDGVFGPALAELLRLDQHARADRAREALGWRTGSPTLKELLSGGYTAAAADVWT